MWARSPRQERRDAFGNCNRTYPTQHISALAKPQHTSQLAFRMTCSRRRFAVLRVGSCRAMASYSWFWTVLQPSTSSSTWPPGRPVPDNVSLGWPWMAYFEVTKFKFSCAISSLRVDPCLPLDTYGQFNSMTLIWRHESAIPATAGLLVLFLRPKVGLIE